MKAGLRRGAKCCDAPVDLYAFFVSQLGPARDFFKRAQATAAHIVPQRGGAVPHAGTFRGDFL